MQPKISNFHLEQYKTLCEEWLSASTQLSELEAYVASLRAEIITQSKGERMEYGVKVSQVESKGKVDYKGICASLNLNDSILDNYRGEPSSYWKITRY